MSDIAFVSKAKQFDHNNGWSRYVISKAWDQQVVCSCVHTWLHCRENCNLNCYSPCKLFRYGPNLMIWYHTKMISLMLWLRAIVALQTIIHQCCLSFLETKIYSNRNMYTWLLMLACCMLWIRTPIPAWPLSRRQEGLKGGLAMRWIRKSFYVQMQASVHWLLHGAL